MAYIITIIPSHLFESFNMKENDHDHSVSQSVGISKWQEYRLKSIYDVEHISMNDVLYVFRSLKVDLRKTNSSKCDILSKPFHKVEHSPCGSWKKQW